MEGRVISWNTRYVCSDDSLIHERCFCVSFIKRTLSNRLRAAFVSKQLGRAAVLAVCWLHDCNSTEKQNDVCKCLRTGSYGSTCAITRAHNLSKDAKVKLSRCPEKCLCCSKNPKLRYLWTSDASNWASCYSKNPVQNLFDDIIMPQTLSNIQKSFGSQHKHRASGREGQAYSSSVTE